LSIHPLSLFKLATPTVLRRPQVPAGTRRTDEDFINRSLLDSLDAQADAEPLSTSDSEAPQQNPSSASTSSSIGSPPIPFQHNLHSLAADSTNMLPNHIKPPHIVDAFNQVPSNPNQPLYHNLHAQSDFSTIPLDNDIQQQQDKSNGFPPGPFNTGSVFGAFGNPRSRHAANAAAYRDQPAPFRQGYEPLGQSPSVNPLAVLQSQSPPSSQATYELLHSQRGHDFAGPLSAGLAQQKPYATLDSFGSAMGPSMFQSTSKHGLLPNGHALSQSRSFPSGPQYPNGMHSQTPFGPHLPVNGSAPPAVGLTAPTVTHVNSSQGSSQEEISTIFVVGFPDDMQVCPLTIVINDISTNAFTRNASFKICSHSLLDSKQQR
jgi:hypothetical protein